MLCDDFARLGYHDVVVDAGVQLSYNRDTSKEMIARECAGVNLGGRDGGLRSAGRWRPPGLSQASLSATRTPCLHARLPNPEP
jgi:hypothetical protein